ncbi:MAG: hypothetical protein K2P93_07730 [Alphaproteobacteria bacterium]|nr:hypothetical protein [Alphaproteobacteria bacterium]
MKKQIALFLITLGVLSASVQAGVFYRVAPVAPSAPAVVSLQGGDGFVGLGRGSGRHYDRMSQDMIHPEGAAKVRVGSHFFQY